MTGPILIHVGYHKTASTWLQGYLFRNAALGFAVRNGGDRVMREFVLRGPFSFDPERVRALLVKHILPIPPSARAQVISQERLCGSPHSGGYDSQVIADRLKSVFPDARILIVIREPAALILSAYKQYVRSGGHQSLGMYLAPPESGAGHLPAFRFEFFEYNRLIQYYRALFGEAGVLTLPYEMFARQPESFIRRILSFCELPYDDRDVSKLPFQERSHPSLSFFTTEFKRRLGFVADVPSRYQHRGLLSLHAAQRQQLLEFLDGFDQRLPPGLRERSDAAARGYIRREVKDRYNASNALTGKLIGLSLDPFGYNVSADVSGGAPR